MMSACGPGERNFQGVPASISEDRQLPYFKKILAKDVTLYVLIGWTGQAGRLHHPIREKKIK
jgi:hypothetical protein